MRVKIYSTKNPEGIDLPLKKTIQNVNCVALDNTLNIKYKLSNVFGTTIENKQIGLNCEALDNTLNVKYKLSDVFETTIENKQIGLNQDISGCC